MENFVNKIKTKDGVEYDIRDERVPQILAESAGKVLAVNEEGNAFEFKEVSTGGTKLYLHTITKGVVDFFKYLSTSNQAFGTPTFYNLGVGSSNVMLLTKQYVPVPPVSGWQYKRIFISNTDGTITVDSEWTNESDLVDTVTEL